MTVVSKEKEAEVRKSLRNGRQSRYAIIRDLVKYGMSENEATDYVDRIASEVYDVPTADEREEIREQHVQREKVGGYRGPIIIGGLILVISFVGVVTGLAAGLLSIFGFVFGLGILLFGVRIMLTSHAT